MEDRIIEILKNVERPLLVEELDSLLNISTVEDTKILADTIRSMEENAILYRTNKHKYMLLEDSSFKKGILHMTKKGYGFVDLDQEREDVYINEDHLNDALDGDLVLVEIVKVKEENKQEGKVVRVVKRNLSTIVGEIYFKKGKGYIIPDDKKLKMILEIPKGKNLGSVDGHKVVVKITNSLGKGKYQGEVTKIIGHKNDPGVDILSIVYKYNIKSEFDKETIAQLDSIPEEVTDKDRVGRRDLTDEVIFTIDGDDTKDIDDAISIEKLDNGNYKLGVHIADVSYYVREGTALDNEAMERGTSVYLVDRVIPMLPHMLSNGICSLNPEVERLAISCVMEVDCRGKTVSYEIFESIIKSRIQMTYKKVNQILEDNITPEEYEPYVDKLLLMKELSDIIRKSKEERGSLDFEIDEPKILVDEDCKPTEIVLRNRGVGEKLIEDFMIQANECVATHIFYMELPFIYRVHEYPKEDKIKSFLTFLNTLGYSIPSDIKGITPKSMQKLLDYLKTKKEFKILSSLLLRNMQKAVYLPQNLGHYGLASKCYTHFTSPIRRYPDTTVHRLLRTYLFENKMSSDVIKHWEEKLVLVADQSSERERASIDCEREVEDMKMAEYMEQHVGDEFKGIIVSVANFGMFVQLENLIEGLVSFNTMKEFMNYDELTQTLTGEKSGIKYRLGDEVMVRVISASKEEKTIDFEIIKRL